ncbi:MAG: TonB-dependent receptor [Candidatus Binatia bacterium]|nr:TonB-dependent receptor [Candidatus Binatia bacterium]
MFRHTILLAVLGAGLVFADLAPAQDLPPGGEELPDKGRSLSKIEEIVVQARKRTEFIEDTPISVTAISEYTMDEIGAFRIDDVTQLVPNLTMITGRNDAEAAIFIRGVGTSSTEIAFDPGVGVYVDGVFLPRAFGTIVNIVDIQQIEVLRGPQGTLFGKNTIGGAINITTIKPQMNEFEGTAAVWAGNLSTANTRATLNIPIIEDQLAMRVAFGSTYDTGYATNTYLNRDASNSGSLTFLGSLRYQPIENLTVDVSGSWAKNHSNGLAGECLVIRPSPLAGENLQKACGETTPREMTADFPGLADVESYGAWGNIQYDVGPVGVLDDLLVKSITSWREQIPRIGDDLDQTLVPRVSFAHMGGSPQNGEPNFQRQIQQEFQVNGSAWDERINVVTGAFLFWEWADDHTSTTSELPSPFPSNISGNDTSTDNFTWALFGQASVDVTDWLSLTGGIRYTQDEKNVHKVGFDFLDDSGHQIEYTVDDKNGTTFDAWTPMGSIAATLPDDWIDDTPIDHLMGYFTYSRGFKGGGFNATLSGASEEFQPEFLDSFEIGLKTIMFDQRLVLNVSPFYGKYDDLQVTTFVADPVDPLIVNRVTLNAAKATTKGIEAELTAIPIDGLLLRATGGVLDATYDEFTGVNSADSQPINREGEHFNNVPEYQAYLSAQYAIPLTSPGPAWLEGAVTPRVSWAYRSSVSYAGPELPEATQGGFGLLDARLSYEFLDGRALVALWGKNLTDEEYFINTNALVPIFGFLTRFYGAPRTYGGELRYRF